MIVHCLVVQKVRSSSRSIVSSPFSSYSRNMKDAFASVCPSQSSASPDGRMSIGCEQPSCAINRPPATSNWVSSLTTAELEEIDGATGVGIQGVEQSSARRTEFEMRKDHALGGPRD